MSTVTAAEFNQRPSQVKKAAADAPVIITEHNRPAFVLLRFEDYERLRSVPTDLASLLAMETDDDFEIPEVGISIDPAAL